jgi:hypothetical protein
MYFCWEDLEIDKRKDTLVSILGKKTRILLRELGARGENGKELEEEDDYP